jgi:hypothetical protein
VFGTPPSRSANLIRLSIVSTREHVLAILGAEEAQRLRAGQILGNLLKIGTKVMEWTRESEAGEPHLCAETSLRRFLSI